ncbi:MAG: glycosyl hydrolase family 79 C-terminal domain-containing protein [Solirubrobacteraceae bacterium]
MSETDNDRWPVPHRGIIRVGVGVAAAAAIALVVVLLASSEPTRSAASVTTSAGPRSPGAPAGSPPAEVTIRGNETTRSIPRSFFGLSTEYWTLPVDELHIALYRRVISLLHVPGDGPFVLRIGGDSSDHTFFDPKIRRLPSWAFDLTRVFIARTARLVREMKLRVILDLNLITATPQLAGAWAREAERVMPRGSIIGFEIGNEPDLYTRTFWRSTTEDDKFGGRILPAIITPTSYVAAYRSYARELARVAPHVPLLAPALADPYRGINWISKLLSGPHPGLRDISGHRYPYAACAFPGSPLYPTIARVLSEKATAGMAQTIKPAVRLASRAHLRFVLTELNSVTCGGLPGVSNTFATALWAPDAAFELLRAGALGIHLHAREFAINDPFTFNATGFLARPLLYGLMLFARALGPGARLVPTHFQTSRSTHLKVWAVKSGGRTLRVLLINKGPASVSVGLSLPAKRPARLERLLAPSPRSTSGMTLGGQWLDSQAAWRGTPSQATVSPQAHRYSVTLPRYSAALVTASVAGGALK